MAVQTVFRRYELKYRISLLQEQRLLQAMAPYLEPDGYGPATIRNVYLDTDSFLLIRRSIEKPPYKEKLRLRSYAQAGPGEPVFVELKKKYRHVVYKRRLQLPEAQAMAWVAGAPFPGQPSQISREIDYALGLYPGLRPRVFLSYERKAYRARDGSAFRVTFDRNILCRREALSLREGLWGQSILPEGQVLMELKCPGAMPLWMARLLSREGIFRSSFSKYGQAYSGLILPRLQEAGAYSIQEAKDNV